MDQGLRTMKAMVTQYNARSGETIRGKRASLPPQLQQPNLMIPSQTLQYDLRRLSKEPLEVGFQGVRIGR